MDFSNLKAITREGFVGFRPVGELWRDASGIPAVPGVYLVLRLTAIDPIILPTRPGYQAGDRYPPYNVPTLEDKWVRGTPVHYIGKAGAPDERATLAGRIGTYLRFGRGRRAAHGGGRAIWQLADHAQLLVCWRPEANPPTVETQLLAAFRQRYGRLPFANWLG